LRQAITAASPGGGDLASCYKRKIEMAVEQHPQHAAWNEALERLIAAERPYHTALMEKRTYEELQPAARELDEARTSYQNDSGSD